MIFDCNSCSYWSRMVDQTLGKCRRRAPRHVCGQVDEKSYLGESSDDRGNQWCGEWPITGPTEGCGEHSELDRNVIRHTLIMLGGVAAMVGCMLAMEVPVQWVLLVAGSTVVSAALNRTFGDRRRKD